MVLLQERSENMKSTPRKKDFTGGIDQLIQTYQYGQLLQNKTRLSILMYLRMNERLSFGQLTHLVGKSKSTVHHHLHKMIRGGLIQEVEANGPRSQFDLLSRALPFIPLVSDKTGAYIKRTLESELIQNLGARSYVVGPAVIEGEGDSAHIFSISPR